MKNLNNKTKPVRSSLIGRNITIFKRRTSIRLEPEMWDALNNIADREKCSIHDLCSLIFIRKKEGTSLTAAIRVFLMLYFRSASSEEGHNNAGHGSFSNMKARARIPSEFEGFFDKKRRYKSRRNNDDVGSSSAA
ncbi:MAG: ribbon-helix-helix domain-containing protein [Alphaproteobacteria bacterium]